MNLEKYSLKRNDFQQTLSSSFKLLRTEENFFDVTLISDDQKFVKGHKLVLSACSEIFKMILKNASAANSFIFLPGISSKNLEFIMDYIYKGEVMIFQDQLDEFLEDAQKLKIAGLISTESEKAVEEETIHRSQNQKVINQTCIQENEVLNDSMIEDMSVTPVMNPNSQVAKLKLTNMDATELDEQILEMISVVYGRFSCIVCAYTSDIC